MVEVAVGGKEQGLDQVWFREREGQKRGGHDS